MTGLGSVKQYPESQKTGHSILAHKFGKCRRFLKFFHVGLSSDGGAN